MRLSPDPHRAALQLTALKSRKQWMRMARKCHAAPLRVLGKIVRYATPVSEQLVQDSIRMARRASRSSWQINRSPN